MRMAFGYWGTWGGHIPSPTDDIRARAHMHNARVSILLACVSQRTLSERVRLRGRLSNRTSFRRLRPSGTEAYVSEVTIVPRHRANEDPRIL